MLDERDPMFRAALAPFEDARYRRQAIVAEIDREFDQRAADLAKANAERDKHDEQQLADLQRMAGDRKTSEPEPPGGWERKERRTVLSFGDHDQEAEPSSPPPSPRPASAPALAQEVPPAAPARERFLSFGADEDDSPAPSKQPSPRQAPRRAAPPPEDDDDFSGHSWVR